MSAAPPLVGVIADGVGFAYAGAGRPALRDVSFRLEPGACLLVVGPSGSGKSTLALALAGLVPHEIRGEWRGRLTVGGVEPRRAGEPAAGGPGLLFQDADRQLVMERAEDDVAFGLENRGWAVDAMHERVPRALADVGLGGFERRRAIRLSGGERQRLALAGVLAPQPGLLILDEPAANLDPDGARILFATIAAIRERHAATIVLVAHDAAAAWPLADCVLALSIEGSPIDVGPPREVLERSRGAMAAAGIWLPDDPIGRPLRPGACATPLAPREAVVAARSVAFGYDRRRPFLQADLEIAAGERIALVGPNGSGKSTLGRLLVGLLRPGSGTIRLGGDDPARLPAAELARRAGYVFQEPERQFLAGTVGEEVRLGLRDDERPRADALMDRIGLPLTVFGDRSPYLLSGGEQRRLSVACVLVRRPGLLVLDEPTFGQDRRGHEALLAMVRERVGEGTAVVAATHDERFVGAFAERVARMRAGRIEAVS